MSQYEVEHDIPAEQKQEQPRRRPDLGTFFSQIDLVDTSGSHRPNNSNSLPLPRDISAAFRTLANAFDMMRGGTGTDSDVNQNELLGRLVESLMESAEHPPTRVDGVSDEFIAQLDRVPKKSLKPDMICPICANPFLEDSHPLVVQIPCHGKHIFDLECIQPWLKLNPTCPMDREKLIKEKPISPPPAEENDGEYDDLYA